MVSRGDPLTVHRQGRQKGFQTVVVPGQQQRVGSFHQGGPLKFGGIPFEDPGPFKTEKLRETRGERCKGLVGPVDPKEKRDFFPKGLEPPKNHLLGTLGQKGEKTALFVGVHREIGQTFSGNDVPQLPVPPRNGDAPLQGGERSGPRKAREQGFHGAGTRRPRSPERAEGTVHRRHHQRAVLGEPPECGNGKMLEELFRKLGTRGFGHPVRP